MNNKTTQYRRINNIINNTQGTFVSLTTPNYTGTVNVLNVSNYYVTVKPVRASRAVKIHKNSILALSGINGDYNRKFANKN